MCSVKTFKSGIIHSSTKVTHYNMLRCCHWPLLPFEKIERLQLTLSKCYTRTIHVFQCTRIYFVYDVCNPEHGLQLCNKVNTYLLSLQVLPFRPPLLPLWSPLAASPSFKIDIAELKLSSRKAP